MKSTISFLVGVVLVLFWCSDCPAETLRSLVILANFQDTASNISRDQYDQFFNAGNYSAENGSVSVRRYVQEVSGGVTDITFTVLDWISLPRSAAQYEALDANSINEGPIAMMQDAIELLKGRGFDFTLFDNDGDGRAELIGMVHRGSNPVFGTGLGPDWSTVPAFSPAIDASGTAIERAWMITDSNAAFGTMTTIGGVIHEMVGHLLCNRPDLYGWSASSWGQMYGGNAFSPTHISAFTKQGCGWITIRDIETAGDVSISPVEESGIAYRLWIDPYRESEYFLLEYRKRINLDQSLPASGLLIWHVDYFADQSSFLRLEQADGRDDLVQTFGFGAADEGDPFPGSPGNNTFAPESSPSSSSRKGEDTGIRIENITEDISSNRIQVNITPSAHLKGITLKYDETYPAWSWYWSPPNGNVEGERMAVRFTSPSNGVLTKVKVNLSGPGPPLSEQSTIDYDLKVYDDFTNNLNLPNPAKLSQQDKIPSPDSGTGEYGWYVIPLTSSFQVTAGVPFVVDLGFSEPRLSIDYYDEPDGESYYRAPDEIGYAGIPYDLRVRAVIDTDVPSFPTGFAIKEFRTDATGPLPVDSRVEFTVHVEGDNSPLYYQFWIASGYGPPIYGSWAIVNEYSVDNSCQWTAPEKGNYVLVAWVTDDTTRNRFHQAGLNIETLENSANPIQVLDFTTDIGYPQSSGDAISLDTTATGGSGALYYEYYCRKLPDGEWVTIRAYDTQKGCSWTPTEEGVYVVVVHVTDDISGNIFSTAGMTLSIGD